MKTENIQFQIDQLRKDKIIYATEATAITLVCLLVFFLTKEYVSEEISQIINGAIGIIAIGYTAYMGIGNFLRLKRIKELESFLKS